MRPRFAGEGAQDGCTGHDKGQERAEDWQPAGHGLRTYIARHGESTVCGIRGQERSSMRELRVGDDVALTLEFAGGAKITVQLEVRGPSGK